MLAPDDYAAGRHSCRAREETHSGKPWDLLKELRKSVLHKADLQKKFACNGEAYTFDGFAKWAGNDVVALKLCEEAI